MVGFVKKGGDGLVLLLIPDDPRKSYHGARSGISNIGQRCNGIGRESDEDLHSASRDGWEKGDLVVGMKGFSKLKEVAIFAESAGGLEREECRVSVDEEVPELFCGKRFGGVKSFFGQPDGETGLGEIKNAHGSPSQSGHGARGFVSSRELMILGFIGDGFTEKFFWGVGSLAESGTQVDLSMAT
jgi:hypothetical protein